jgi:dTMP kinase
MARLHEKHTFPGRLIIVEGIDGSGKTTQAQLLRQWLVSLGVPVFWTEWNSSALVKSSTKKAKKDNTLTPTTFSLLHVTDFADRLSYKIIPPLQAGMVVIADRYSFTAFARDTARGVHPDWVRSLYDFAIKPDLAVYFKVPIRVSLKRLLSARMKLKFYEAGMDTGLSTDPVTCFELFQSRVLDEYDRMSEEFGFHVVDAVQPIQAQQRQFRALIERELQSYLAPYLKASDASATGIPSGNRSRTSARRPQA